jgi:hypothetical protein
MKRLLQLHASKERGDYSKHRVEAYRIRIAIHLTGDLVRRRADQEVDKTWADQLVAQYSARLRKTTRSRARRLREVSSSGLQNNCEKAVMSLTGKRLGER